MCFEHWHLESFPKVGITSLIKHLIPNESVSCRLHLYNHSLASLRLTFLLSNSQHSDNYSLFYRHIYKWSMKESAVFYILLLKMHSICLMYVTKLATETVESKCSGGFPPMLEGCMMVLVVWENRKSSDSDFLSLSLFQAKWHFFVRSRSRHRIKF